MMTSPKLSLVRELEELAMIEQCGRRSRQRHGMKRSPSGNLANVPSGTLKLVASRRCGLAAIQAVSEIELVDAVVEHDQQLDFVLADVLDVVAVACGT